MLSQLRQMRDGTIIHTFVGHRGLDVGFWRVDSDMGKAVNAIQQTGLNKTPTIDIT